MGVFDNVIKTATNAGKAVVSGASKVGSNIGVVVSDNSELAGLKMQKNAIEQELEALYLTIGRRYVEYIMSSGEKGPVDIADTLKIMDPKMSKKLELEKEIAELEKKMMDQGIAREKQRAEEDFLAEKSKLDKALQMSVISQEEYDSKISVARKKLDNFEEIRRIESQCSMGIITNAEKQSKIDELLK